MNSLSKIFEWWYGSSDVYPHGLIVAGIMSMCFTVWMSWANRDSGISWSSFMLFVLACVTLLPILTFVLLPMVSGIMIIIGIVLLLERIYLTDKVK